MSTTFRPYAPDQMLLLPADVRAWLPDGEPSFAVATGWPCCDICMT